MLESMRKVNLEKEQSASAAVSSCCVAVRPGRGQSQGPVELIDEGVYRGVREACKDRHFP
jgi:hypothetical protein